MGRMIVLDFRGSSMVPQDGFWCKIFRGLLVGVTILAFCVSCGNGQPSTTRGRLGTGQAITEGADAGGQ